VVVDSSPEAAGSAPGAARASSGAGRSAPARRADEVVREPLPRAVAMDEGAVPAAEIGEGRCPPLESMTSLACRRETRSCDSTASDSGERPMM
jgi:hypothetical protein